jgi:hypothetical protein
MARRTLDQIEMDKIIATNGYLFPKQISGDRTAAVLPMLFTHAIITMCNDDRAEVGYEDRWCYHHLPSAIVALSEWNGEGEPQGWHRHPPSGRRRDADGKEYVAA